jgi:CubicO group peptidase (beta-lactamase class C family)
LIHFIETKASHGTPNKDSSPGWIVLFLALLLVQTAAPQPVDSGKDRFDLEKTRAVLTGLIEKRLQESGVPSISIALVRGDAIVWKAAFGYSNVRTKTLATPDTLYNAGSTFKSVTATALMQLVEQGKFRLKDPVNNYLGDHPIRDRIQSEKPVNFIHILSHWSGLTSWPGRGETTMKPVWSRELPNTLEQVASELYSIRAPETKFEYDNYGYGLAGR